MLDKTLRTANAGRVPREGGPMMRMVVWIALVLLLACGGSEEPKSDAGTSPASETASPKAKFVTREQLEKIWKWPADRAPARDIVAEWIACGEQVKDQAAGLGRLKLAGACMNEKGWEAATER